MGLKVCTTSLVLYPPLILRNRATVKHPERIDLPPARTGNDLYLYTFSTDATYNHIE
jgi:hypothetical protein